MEHDEFLRMLDSGDGDQLEALTVIINKVKKQFTSYARSESGSNISEYDIDEIIEDSIFVFITKMRDESITITSKVEAYIFGIAKLKLREFYRIKEKQKKAMEALGLLNEEETKETEQDVDLDLVIRYLENLNPICQDLIKLKFWGDKTHAEISTSIPELLNDNNSRQRLRYCLGQLRQFFLENIKN